MMTVMVAVTARVAMAATAVTAAMAVMARVAAAICTYLNLNVSCIVIRCQLRYIDQDYAHIKQLLGA
jgi:hypothetical protein